jgi:hypothetical protein
MGETMSNPIIKSFVFYVLLFLLIFLPYRVSFSQRDQESKVIFFVR